MKKRLFQTGFLLALIVGSVLIIKHRRDAPYQSDQGMVFGTEYHITYQCDSDIRGSIEGELRRVDLSLSMFNDSSALSRVNRGESDEADDMLCHVFRLAKKISEDTDGAFDITVAPLVSAWGFGSDKEKRREGSFSVDSILSFVGYKKVTLSDHRIVKSDPRVMIDMSAIAKGYAVDRVALLLRRRDVANYMVEIGGEIAVRGLSPKRLPWKIGVTRPVDDSLSLNGELEKVLNITNRCLATSGNYRNFYFKGGKKYAHTIDPKSGRPVQHSLLSATVVASDCATADAYATAFMVMGKEKACRLLTDHSELKAYLIYDDKGQNKEWSNLEE